MGNEDVLKDSCAVFGCSVSRECLNETNVFSTIYLGLIALQHRGQESSGMVLSDGKEFSVKKGMGLVDSVYADVTPNEKGYIGIGHNRYSTTGKSLVLNCQPFVVHSNYGKIAVAHNGELVNAGKIRKSLLKQGIGLSTESDSELITQLLVQEPPGEQNGVDWVSRITNLMQIAECSFSCVMLTSENEIFAFRDPFGNRPLCIGELSKNTSIECGESKKVCRQLSMYIVSSESCAFTSIGAALIRDVNPGEIIRICPDGIQSLGIVGRNKEDSHSAFCIFEYVYFARPDSFFEGQEVYTVRKECGRQLALESAVEADVVSTIPDSAGPAARGFSEKSGIPYEDVFIKNRYIGRTFIQPNSADRKLGITTKFGTLNSNIKGNRIVLIDDSIVRGNTMPHVIEMLKNAGAKEIHIRIASPPLKHPCFMGINIPTKEELIANDYNSMELAKYWGVDSLVYLSLDGLTRAVKKNSSTKQDGHCMSCLTGKYPVQLQW
uniref:Amidophosphoribosyltransferase n=1 Tax=Hydra vulgaris TaxID=6087 RepID=T2MEF1_HYDVU